MKLLASNDSEQNKTKVLSPILLLENTWDMKDLNEVDQQIIF